VSKEGSAVSREIYYHAIAAEIPRLLGLLDRNAASASYGCFDRHYWNALDTDFPCARCQEAVLTLALLYALKRDDNPYCGNGNILAWIDASLDFWCRIQERGGGFSEMYPHENAIVATAFSSYAVSESLLVLGAGAVGRRARIIGALCRAGDWLMPRVDRVVVNQTAGAAIALHNIYALTGEERYRAAARDKIAAIGRAQDEEGWLPEDGGADIGYLSLAIDYLAKYYDKSRDGRALAILTRAVSFIAPFIDARAPLGGSCGSRSTEYLIPSGFEILSPYCPKARAAARAVRAAMRAGSTVLPSSLDDRYLDCLGYTYLQAYLHATEGGEEQPHGATEGTVRYPRAGVTIIRNRDVHFAHNARKGGTFKAVFPNGRVVDDWGIVAISADGTAYFSAWMNPPVSCGDPGGGDALASTVPFRRVTQRFPRPETYALFRLFLSTLGRSESVSGRFRAFLRKRLMSRDEPRSPFHLERRISFRREGMTVFDRISGTRGIGRIIVGAKATFLYVLSAHYHLSPDLDRPVFSFDIGGGRGETVCVRRDYSFDGSLRRIELE
jgi:hypothetical protein